jgi:hypothetical protein
VIFIDWWRVTSNKSSLLSTDDQIFMVETMDAKAVSYAAGEFLELVEGVFWCSFVELCGSIGLLSDRPVRHSMCRLGWEANVCGFEFLRFGSAAYGAFCVEVVECCGMLQILFKCWTITRYGRV